MAPFRTSSSPTHNSSNSLRFPRPFSHPVLLNRLARTFKSIPTNSSTSKDTPITDFHDIPSSQHTPIITGTSSPKLPVLEPTATSTMQEFFTQPGTQEFADVDDLLPDVDCVYDRNYMYSIGVSDAVQQYLQDVARNTQHPMPPSPHTLGLNLSSPTNDTFSFGAPQTPIREQYQTYDQDTYDETAHDDRADSAYVDDAYYHRSNGPSPSGREEHEHDQEEQHNSNAAHFPDGPAFMPYEDNNAFFNDRDQSEVTDADTPSDDYETPPTTSAQQFLPYDYTYQSPTNTYHHQLPPPETVVQSIETKFADSTASYSTNESGPASYIPAASTFSDSSASLDGDTTGTSFDDADGDDCDGLHFDSLAAAMTHAYNRTKPLIEQDDWQQMEDTPKSYIKQIMSAFKTNGIATPRGHDLDAAEQARFAQFQRTHIDKVTHYSTKKNIAMELAAWQCFKAVIDCHKIGIKNFKMGEYRASCSMRFNEVVQLIADYAIVRWDIIRDQRIEELAADPVAFINRKLANFVGNSQKKKRDEENVAVALEKGVKYNPVLGTKRKSTGGQALKQKKRKRSNFDDEEVETEESLGEEPAAKRQR